MFGNRLEEELEILRGAGLIADFTITTLDDGRHVEITPGENSPSNLRNFLAHTLESLISQERISLAD